MRCLMATVIVTTSNSDQHWREDAGEKQYVFVAGVPTRIKIAKARLEIILCIDVRICICRLPYVLLASLLYNIRVGPDHI